MTSAGSHTKRCRMVVLPHHPPVCHDSEKTAGSVQGFDSPGYSKSQDQLNHYPLQLNSNANQPLNPAQVAEKLKFDSLTKSAPTPEKTPELLAVKVEFTLAKLISELLWGVLGTDGNSSVGYDERRNLVILRGEKKWIDNVRKLIETLDRCGTR